MEIFEPTICEAQGIGKEEHETGHECFLFLIREFLLIILDK